MGETGSTHAHDNLAFELKSQSNVQIQKLSNNLEITNQPDINPSIQTIMRHGPAAKAAQ